MNSEKINKWQWFKKILDSFWEEQEEEKEEMKREEMKREDESKKARKNQFIL